MSAKDAGERSLLDEQSCRNVARWARGEALLGERTRARVLSHARRLGGEQAHTYVVRVLKSQPAGMIGP